MYTEMEIRKGRPVYSDTSKEQGGVAEFNEEFHLIVSEERSTTMIHPVVVFTFNHSESNSYEIRMGGIVKILHMLGPLDDLLNQMHQSCNVTLT